MQAARKNELTERGLFLLDLSGVEKLQQNLDIPSPYFGFFLVCNAEEVTDSEIKQLARALVKRGMVYMCSWGPDCERVHDLFDSVIVELSPHETESSVRMTTWLDEQSLDEALWHFLNIAFPADDYWDNCKAELITVIGNPGWATQIRARISNQTGLSRDVVEDEDDDEDAV
jgi:hypothetical protein